MKTGPETASQHDTSMRQTNDFFLNWQFACQILCVRETVPDVQYGFVPQPKDCLTLVPKSIDKGSQNSCRQTES